MIILASARKGGETSAFLNTVFADIPYKTIDLLDNVVSPYDYTNRYPDSDDFSKIITEVLQHRVVVFATPVYWYAMSGLLKTFFDRLTDLVTVQKQMGRQLRGKATFLLAVGADPELPPGFEVPFQLTSEYLDMHYQGCIYQATKFSKATDIQQEEIRGFTEKIKTHLAAVVT